ncbi:DUF2490 domain-containing protein [Flammeovirgaceae bacterium SG7u.111]|nr:DUF2490 domain-containing protein [Flammeovirgaceae bacterium SG7u.132]WPO36402.1 DUF2490 domain-containing protein [Flammeovirgaceae bacterium SG7u.111]
MLKRTLIFFVLILLLMEKKAVSQDQSESYLRETGLWYGAYIKVKLSKKLGYYGEHHLRFKNSEENLHDFTGMVRQIYNRAGLNIFFNEYFEAVIGPTLVLNFTPHPGDPEYEKVTYEPRIWHQWLLMMPPMGRVKIYNQFRFEHRWKKKNKVGSPYNYTNRYRYKLFAYIPINNKKIKEKTFFFSPSVELFMHSGKSVVYDAFEDFRTYNGFGYVLNKNVTFFAGHMWTYGQDKSGYEYGKSHVIRLNVLFGFDARKIEKKLPPINIGY